MLPEFALTYAGLRDSAIDVARGIIGLGIAPRSHIGILANNSRELVASIFGAALANCVAVPLNARHKTRVTKSAPPPGGYGTITRTGRAG